MKQSQCIFTIILSSLYVHVKNDSHLRFIYPNPNPASVALSIGEMLCITSWRLDGRIVGVCLPWSKKAYAFLRVLLIISWSYFYDEKLTACLIRLILGMQELGYIYRCSSDVRQPQTSEHGDRMWNLMMIGKTVSASSHRAEMASQGASWTYMLNMHQPYVNNSAEYISGTWELGEIHGCEHTCSLDVCQAQVDLRKTISEPKTSVLLVFIG